MMTTTLSLPTPSNKSRSAPPLFTLAPEIFPLISKHIPRSYRASSLLATALACRRLCDNIIPHVLYRDVRLRGDQFALAFLVQLRAAAELTSENDVQMGHIPLSHRIHFLCIDQDKDPADPESPNRALHELHMLILCGGLRNLESLTVHLQGEYGEWESTGHKFWITVQIQCPRLREVQLAGILEQEKSWLADSGIFQLQVCSLPQGFYLIIYATSRVWKAYA